MATETRPHVGPVQRAITEKLRTAFSPDHLEVINETHLHSSPIGAEGLFKVVVVSESFTDRSLLDRHRAVHEALVEELANAVHGITIHARTPAEWARLGGMTPATRRCMGDAEAGDLHSQ
ncbi:MAG: BolA family transcriptional regulator [Gemmatimonadetes bacterium]|nr:BolA family transcriptional regulator [Gemmatimonadota bacterium]